MAAEIPGEARQYVTDEGIRLFENGRIFSPEEALAVTYGHRETFPQLVLICGPSGSGKSTWVESQMDGFARVSLDEIRKEITGRRDDQSKNGQVMQLAKERLREELRKPNGCVIWEATSLRSDFRNMVLGLGHDYHVATRLVCFPCDPGELLSRNRSRKHAIPTSVLQKQLDSLEWPEVYEAHVVEALTVLRPRRAESLLH